MSNTLSFLEKWKESKKKFVQAHETKKTEDRAKFGGGGGGGGSGGKPPPFSMRMRYGYLTEVSEKNRFIPGKNGELFYKYWKSWIKVGDKPRTAICNCEQMTKPVPCVPCYLVANNDRPDLIPKPSYAVTRVRLVTFHKVMNPSKKEGGKEYATYEKCKGVDKYGKSLCPLCDAGVEKEFGRADHVTLSNRQAHKLEEALNELADKCGNCGKGELSTWGYSCPECGTVIASQRDGSITDEDEVALRSGDITCPSCDATVRAKPEVECVESKIERGVQVWVAGCDNPTPVDPLGVDVFIRKKENAFVIDGHSQIDDPEDMASHKTEPFDFDYFFKYQDLDEQARALGVANPFSDAEQKIIDDLRAADAAGGGDTSDNNTATVPY